MKYDQSIYFNKIDDIYSNGFTILNSVFSHQEVKEIKDKILNLSESLLKPDESTIPKLNRGHDVIYNLETKDIFFIRLNLKIVDFAVIESLIEVMKDYLKGCYGFYYHCLLFLVYFLHQCYLLNH